MDDPTRKLIPPKVPKRLPRPADGERVRKLLTDLDGGAWLMVALALFCGLRAMEIAQARPCDVRRQADGVRVLHVLGKGRRERAVPLPDAIADRLGVLPPDRPAVLNRYGEPYTPQGISTALARMLRAAGIEATGHQLRHAFGTAVYQSSHGDLLATQRALGHQGPDSTAIYARADPTVMLAAMRASWSSD